MSEVGLTRTVSVIAVIFGMILAWGFPVMPAAAEPGFAWGTPELIEAEVGNAFSPDVAVDPQGNAVAVWSQRDGFAHIWANRFVPGVGWGTAELIETHDSTGDFEPQVAMDATGNAVAVWRQSLGGLENIWANRFVPGVGWGTETLIETDDAAAREPQIAVDPQGNATAVWHQFTSGTVDIWANRFVPGVGWGTAELIETNASAANFPEVAADPLGNAIAVWTQSGSIWANRFVPGVGWGTAELITDAGSGLPQVAVDPQGNAVAVWHQSIGGPENVWANRFVPGVGWGTAEPIETDAGSAFQMQVAMDATGNAVAVWAQDDGPRLSIAANRFVPGVGWGTAELIETNDAGDAQFPQVAVDPQGNATAVWPQSDGTRDNLWANRFVPGIGWGTAELIETDNAGGVNYIGAQVAVDPQGNATAVWHQFNGTGYNIWSNRFAEVIGPPDLVITSPAEGAILTSTSVTVTGTASDDVGVDKVELGTDGMTWALATGTTSWSGTVTLVEGPNTIFARATDTSGNTATVSVSVTVAVPPTAPQNLQATAGDAQVDLTWAPPLDDGGSAITGYNIHRGTSPGGETFLTAVGTVLAHTDASVTNGVTYYYQVSAVNAVGEGPRSNEASATPMVPDTTNPTVTITSPPDGAALPSIYVFFSGTASDDRAVEMVELSLDGTNYFLVTGTTSWSSGTVTLAEGSNTIFARATDTSGNTATDRITVTTDAVEPTAVAGEDKSASVGEAVSFDASGSSDNVAIVSYAWDFGDGSTGTGETTTHTYTDPGIYTVNLTVRDAVGNVDTDLLIVTVVTEPETPPPGFEVSPTVMIIAGVAGAAAAAAAAFLLWKRRKG